MLNTANHSSVTTVPNHWAGHTKWGTFLPQTSWQHGHSRPSLTNGFTNLCWIFSPQSINSFSDCYEEAFSFGTPPFALPKPVGPKIDLKWPYHLANPMPEDARGLMPWQESHRNGWSLCELWVLFLSCGTLSTGSRMDNWPLPRQTIFAPLSCTMTSFTKLILLHHQRQLLSSTNPSHSTPPGPHHHQELFERSPVGFLLKSTGNQPRSWVQD